MLVDKSQNRGNLKITMGASITSLKLSPDVFERESFAENKFTHWVVSVYVKIYSRVMRHLPKAKPGSVYSAGKTGVATFSIWKSGYQSPLKDKKMLIREATLQNPLFFLSKNKREKINRDIGKGGRGHKSLILRRMASLMKLKFKTFVPFLVFPASVG